MDVPRYRAILRHQLGWAYAGPVTPITDRYVDRSGNDQFVPSLRSFANDQQLAEFLAHLGCQLQAEDQ